MLQLLLLFCRENEQVSSRTGAPRIGRGGKGEMQTKLGTLVVLLHGKAWFLLARLTLVSQIAHHRGSNIVALWFLSLKAL